MKQWLSGSALGLLSLGLSIGQTFLQVSVMLSSWGPDAYGNWVQMMAAWSIVIALDTGHQGYVGNIINRLSGTCSAEARSVLADGVKACCLVGGLELVVLALWAVFARWNGSTEDVAESVEIALLVLTISWTAGNSAFGLLHRVFIAIGQYDRFLIWGICSRLVQFGIWTIAAWGHIALVPASCLFGLVMLAFNYIQWLYLRRRAREYAPVWGDGSIRLGLMRYRDSLGLSLAGFLDASTWNGVLAGVGFFSGGTAVSQLGVLRTVANSFLQIGNQLLFPLQRRFALGVSGPRLRSLMITAHGLSAMFCGLAVLGLAATLPWLQQFLSSWTHGKIQFSWALIVWLLAGCILRMVASPFIQWLTCVNAVRSLAALHGVRLVLAIGGTALLLPSLGLAGVGAAIAISEFCAGIFAYLLVVHRTKLVAGFMGEMQSELVGCLALLIGVLGLYGCAGASAGWITGILCALYTIYLFARRARFQHWKVLAQVNE